MKRILFIGDVVGSAGCGFLSEKLRKTKKKYRADMAVVNGENSARGNGITTETANSIINSGADLITSGNHAFRQKNFLDVYDKNFIIRPANYPEGGCAGRGYAIIDMGTYSVAVINLLGTVSLEPLDNPFSKIDNILKEIKSLSDTPNIFLDFHAEATSEKKAMGFYLAERVTGVFGTHTHVQTADECILKSCTAYITDLGMTGVENSCLGVETVDSVNMFRFRTSTGFRQAEGDCFMCGVCVEFDEKSGRAVSIERILER